MTGHPRKASLAVIFGIVVVDLLGFGIVIPQLGIYAVKFQASPLEVGLLQSVFSLMQFLFAPVLGRLSDRIGRRPVLLVSVAGSLVGYILFAFSQSLEMLFLSRLIDGISGANISTAQAYVADVTTPENRARGMGLVGAAFGLGFLLGPAVGGLLGAWGGNLAIGLGAGALCALNLLMAFLFLPESVTHRAQKPQGVVAPAAPWRAFFGRLQQPVLGPILLLFFVFTVAFAQMEGTLSLYVLKNFLAPEGFAPGNGPVPGALGAEAAFQEASLKVGYIFTAVGFCGVLVQGVLLGLLRKRFGEAVLAQAGLFFGTLGMVAIPLAPSYEALFVGAALLAAGSGLANPSLSALMSIHSPRESQGVMLGAYQSMGALGRIIGPSMGGALFYFVSAQTPYWLASALLALGLLGAVRLAVRLRNLPTPVPARTGEG